MACRFGPGTWPGLTSIKLYDEELVPVCSPAFRGGRLPRSPSNLLKMPLLHDERQPWSLWFKAVGLDYRDTDRGPRYSKQTVLLAAAIAGLGVALARALFVQADLESGRLVRLFAHSVRTSIRTYLYPRARRPRKHQRSSSGSATGSGRGRQIVSDSCVGGTAARETRAWRQVADGFIAGPLK